MRTTRPSSSIGISTTHGAWRMVAISCVRPLPSGDGTFSTSTANTRVEQTIAMDLLRQLVEHALEILRQRAGKFHSPVLGRVRERQTRGMQKRPAEMRHRTKIARHAPVNAAVERIADDRVADSA